MRLPLAIALVTALVATPLQAIADDVRTEPAVPADASALVSSRVLVADDDAELLRALTGTLAPWRLVLVVDREADAAGGRDAKAAYATARAAASGARFVVWRDDAELVVVDRARGTVERRPVRPGPLDPIHAAAAALTVKTMMRLPGTPAAEDRPERAENANEAFDTSGGARTADASTADGMPVAPTSGPELRLQAGIAGRLTRGSQTDLGARGALAALVRPSARQPWRIGLAVELGPGEEVSQSGFKGTWRDASVAAIASWTYESGRYELEPWLAAGLVHITLSGTEMMSSRDESATRPLVRLGVTMRRRVRAWSVGVVVGAESTLGTPAYMKAVGSSQNPIFEVPGIAAFLGAVVAADLGR